MLASGFVVRIDGRDRNDMGRMRDSFLLRSRMSCWLVLVSGSSRCFSVRALAV